MRSIQIVRIKYSDEFIEWNDFRRNQMTLNIFHLQVKFFYSCFLSSNIYGFPFPCTMPNQTLPNDKFESAFNIKFWHIVVNASTKLVCVMQVKACMHSLFVLTVFSIVIEIIIDSYSWRGTLAQNTATIETEWTGTHTESRST